MPSMILPWYYRYQTTAVVVVLVVMTALAAGFVLTVLGLAGRIFW